MDQERHSLIRAAAMTTAVLLLSGCPRETRPSLPVGPDAPVSMPGSAGATSGANGPGANAPGADAPGTAAPTPRTAPPPRENRLSPATRSLVFQAHTQLARGDSDGASSTLDRALRIEPNNPLLWIERGRVRLAENDSHQAEVCGRKALALASGDRTTQKQAGSLLVDSLRAQRRNPEAHDIEVQPYMR